MEEETKKTIEASDINFDRNEAIAKRAKILTGDILESSPEEGERPILTELESLYFDENGIKMGVIEKEAANNNLVIKRNFTVDDFCTALNYSHPMDTEEYLKMYLYLQEKGNLRGYANVVEEDHFTLSSYHSRDERGYIHDVNAGSIFPGEKLDTYIIELSKKTGLSEKELRTLLGVKPGQGLFMTQENKKNPDEEQGTIIHEAMHVGDPDFSTEGMTGAEVDLGLDLCDIYEIITDLKSLAVTPFRQVDKLNRAKPYSYLHLDMDGAKSLKEKINALGAKNMTEFIQSLLEENTFLQDVIAKSMGARFTDYSMAELVRKVVEKLLEAPKYKS